MVQAPPHGVGPGSGGWDSSPGWNSSANYNAGHNANYNASYNAADYDSADDWTQATHVDVQRPAHAERRVQQLPFDGPDRRRPTARERGVASWAALLVLLVIAGIGGVIDLIGGASLKGGFNISLVIASAVAILIVRRSAMFPIVIAPPIVYALGSGANLYVHLHGSSNKRALLVDAAANWLVYGFPAIAGATAIVLIVAGVRMVIRK